MSLVESSCAAADPPALALRLQAATLAHARLAEAAAAAATELSVALGCDRVAIGLRDEADATRLLGVSHQAQAPAERALARALAAAMDEAIDQAATLMHPQPTDGPPDIHWAHEALARDHAGAHAALCSVPLADAGRPLGAIVFERGAGRGFEPAEVALCEHLACLLGPLLELKRRQQRSLPRHALDELRALRDRLLGPGHAGTKLLACAVALAASAALVAAVVQADHRITGQARIEGAVQRVLVAPVDGFIEQVHARPGDVVAAGQVLAELARDELDSERRRWQSQAQQQGQAYAEALARHDRAQLVMALSRAEEARAQLDLAEQTLRRARLEAPFAGVVIQGDLSASLGAPVRRGDVLMTVAQGDGHRVIVEVDERDIAGLRVGQPGRMVLAASPAQPLALRIRRITPVAAVVQGRNVFEVEAAIEGATPPLRPGLRGIARIEAGRRPALWIASHRLVDWLRLQWWSWVA